MKPFKYSVASSANGACRLLGEKALAYAGGTNLLNLMKDYVLEPEVLVDIKNIPEMGGIERRDGGLRIGANVTLAEILASKAIAADYPALRQALYDAGTPQVRNRGTLGGNLCARPSCWYFIREGFDCAKGGGGSCPAKDGDNEHLAIFETDGPCVMVHSSSAAPALLALGSRVGIAGPGSGALREIPLGEFFTLPRADIRRENVLAPNEIVTHVVLGPPSPHSATYEVRQKAAHDWPIAVASVSLDLAFGVCRKARVYLGAVAPAPRRAPDVEAALVNKRLTPAVAETAAAGAVRGAKPLSGNAHKLAATRTAVKRAILVAATGKWQ